MRFSKYCNSNYVHTIEVKKGLLKWFIDIKDKIYDKRSKYDKDGNFTGVNTKGFRSSWFER
jgi:hypothetical protein